MYSNHLLTQFLLSQSTYSKPSASRCQTSLRKKVATPPPFRLLALPQELQDRIFEHHLTMRDKVNPVLNPSSCMPLYTALFPLAGRYEDCRSRRLLDLPGHPPHPNSRLAVLLVCRKLLRDCQHMFTGATTSTSRNPHRCHRSSRT